MPGGSASAAHRCCASPCTATARRALITSAPHSAQMGFKLESLHLYRKIPRDLTDATASGGAISLVCAMVMAYLFISNINEYLKLQTTTDVALDEFIFISYVYVYHMCMIRSII